MNAQAPGEFVSLQEKANRLLADGERFIGGGLPVFEQAGRLQLEVLVHEGVNPSSRVLDVGCGALRGGYWIMHFLDQGRYFGIEPHEDRVKTGLDEFVEPEFVEWAQPRFSYNEDFDLGVFGEHFDFVIARSVWTHTSKAQIEAMLDSFVEWGAPGAVMLPSYLKASRFRRPVTEIRSQPRTFSYRLGRRVLGRPPRKGDYQGSEWQGPIVSHSYPWIQTACSQRGLPVRELDYGVNQEQIWLRIEHP